MHTSATYGTCDMWNYALEWYQVVLGCLRVHKNVFTKIPISEVNFSHSRKIAILRFGPNCTHCCQLICLQVTWSEFENFRPPVWDFKVSKAFYKTKEKNNFRCTWLLDQLQQKLILSDSQNLFNSLLESSSYKYTMFTLSIPSLKSLWILEGIMKRKGLVTVEVSCRSTHPIALKR